MPAAYEFWKSGNFRSQVICNPTSRRRPRKTYSLNQSTIMSEPLPKASNCQVQQVADQSPNYLSAYMPSVRTGICHKSNQSGFLVIWLFSAQCAMHSEHSYWSFQPPGHLVNALNFTLPHLVSPLFVTLTLCVPIHPEFSHEIQKANATDSNTEADSDGDELQISKLIMYVLL